MADLQIAGANFPGGSSIRNNQSTDANMAGVVKTFTGLSVVQNSAFPGQAGNLVGHLNTPATAPATWTGGAWPGAWPGSFTGGTASNQTTVSNVGTQANPIIIAFKDFFGVAPLGSCLVDGQWIKFVGCRFQSNSTQNYNCQTTGSNISFFYCTVQPYASQVTAPGVWPSNGAGQNVQFNSPNGQNFMIPLATSYEYGINVTGGGPTTIDSCDIWGFGNSVVFYSTTQPMIVHNCWIHDAAAGGYHTDGPGYLNGTTPPQNVTITNNTVAMVGNTNSIAFQGATSAYINIAVNNNFLSGDEYTVAMGYLRNDGQNLSFQNNIISMTCLAYGLVQNSAGNFLTGSGNVWKNNIFKRPTGTVPFNSGVDGVTPWTNSVDGQFVLPDGSTSNTDHTN